MVLGEKIKSIRQENKLSQEEFSEKFNVTRQTVSNWENGKSVPDLETIVRMSSEFNVSTDELLKEDKSVVQKIDSEKKKKNTLFMILIVLIVGINFSGVFFYKELQKKNTVSFTMKDHKTVDVKNKKMEEIGVGYFAVPKKGNYQLKLDGEIDSGEVEVLIKNSQSNSTVYENAKDHIEDEQLVLLDEGSYKIQVRAKDMKEKHVSLSYDIRISNK